MTHSPLAIEATGLVKSFGATRRERRGHVFVDPDTLPAGLEAFVDVNPIWRRLREG